VLEGRLRPEIAVDFPEQRRACGSFKLNKARLHVGEFQCVDCGLRFLDHHSDAAVDRDVEKFIYFTSEKGPVSRILDPSASGAGAVFLGSFSAARDKSLDAHNIAAVVNCCDLESMTGRPDFQSWAAHVRSLEAPPRSLRILRLGWADTNTQKVWRDEKFDQLAESVRFIDKERKRTSVLLHCVAGISRSGTVMVAYVMASEGLSFEAALSRVQARRPVVQPNAGFVQQLQEFERSGQLRELRKELGSH
jgi:protein-tyrosine phosphatase